MFNPDRWVVTAYWRNPPAEDLPPYESQSWTYYRQSEAEKMADYLFAHTASHVYVRAWEHHTSRLVRSEIAPGTDKLTTRKSGSQQFGE